MLDPKLLRNEIDAVALKLSYRGYQLDINSITQLEEQRKKIQIHTQELQNERNILSRQIGQAKRNNEDVTSLMEQVTALGKKLEQAEESLPVIQQKLNDYYFTIPNLPHDSVPVGRNESDNLEIRKWGQLPEFDFHPKDHVELGEQLSLMDFKKAAKISGARFVILSDSLARLQRALIQFMLDVHTQKHGYKEFYVPYLVNSESLYGTGQLPKFLDDQFPIAGEAELFLIPTAEVPLTNMVRDEIIEADRLPLKFVAHTPCFRREAGSYGKDTRGMIRQHQFEKVELVQITRPQDSYQVLEELTQHAEYILQQLNLPYRVVSLCTGDLGFSAAKTYDLEVWLPGQNRYREISSCSNFEDFQARRMLTRWRDESGKPLLVHTVNGSGLAAGRTLIAIMENYQDKEGKIHIPKVLWDYMHGQKVLG